MDVLLVCFLPRRWNVDEEERVVQTVRRLNRVINMVLPQIPSI